jgi:cytochrome b561
VWRNDDRSYGLAAIVLHWIVAGLFLVQVPLGYLTQSAENQPVLQADLFWWHKSVGFTILAISLFRILWVLSSRHPGLPESINPSERSAAKWAHVSLYVATLLIPITGWALVSTTAPVAPSPVFGLVSVPPLPLSASGFAEAYWSSAHAFLAYAAAFIAGVHVLAALRHHFTLKDDVMVRMLRPGTGHDDRANE